MGVLRIGVYRDNPPFSFRRDGTLVGVEIGRAIARRLNVEPTYMEITAGDTVEDDLRNAAWKGHYLGGGVADLMLNVPYTRVFALRNPNVAFFAPTSARSSRSPADPPTRRPMAWRRSAPRRWGSSWVAAGLLLDQHLAGRLARQRRALRDGARCRQGPAGRGGGGAW